MVHLLLKVVVVIIPTIATLVAAVVTLIQTELSMGFNNTINNTNFSTTNSTSINSTNNNLFLERQLLLVQQAQEFLLDEYRIGNRNKNIEKQQRISNKTNITNNNIDISKKKIDLLDDHKNKKNSDDSPPLYADPSLDDAEEALIEEKEGIKSELRDEIDIQSSHENIPMRPHLNLSGISSAFTQVDTNNNDSNNKNGDLNQQNQNNKYNLLTAPVVEYKPGPMNHLPVNAQIGIQLFLDCCEHYVLIKTHACWQG